MPCQRRHAAIDRQHWVRLFFHGVIDRWIRVDGFAPDAPTKPTDKSQPVTDDHAV
ncbi:hypothetical protein AArcS_0195 [Natranaeroarchaeum sulfidigenes]|uniref:Uncharacterized protein n=1 Tax=Natranaeroarchaeum sulfidigenes TaxID=2784880 RepID=A0A897MT85_9EURY|nr:hypothetical protein AArcS_0195 [Natranaeroarchaeum sulfidigenes]